MSACRPPAAAAAAMLRRFASVAPKAVARRWVAARVPAAGGTPATVGLGPLRAPLDNCAPGVGCDQRAAGAVHGATRGAASSAADRERGDGAASGRTEQSVRLLFDTKVSASNTADSLFQEAIDAIRQQRSMYQEDKVAYRSSSSAITKLAQDELELTRKVFQRVDPKNDLTSDLRNSAHAIDPYWNPFNSLRDLREQVTAEFDEYARYKSAAEAKRDRIRIKRSLKRCAQVYNPYSEQFREWHSRERGFEQPPKPFRLPDQHWERTPLQERLNGEKITWRDVDIIQHFVADNGYILPRRTTMLTRPQQKSLVKAVKIAQRMSLIPYQRRVQDYQAMPLTDPLQWMADRLTDRVIERRDRRSRAMLQVMVDRYPELNYKRFLAHEAREAAREEGAADGGSRQTSRADTAAAP